MRPCKLGALLAACLVGSVRSAHSAGRMAPIKLTYFNIEGVAEKVRPLSDQHHGCARVCVRQVLMRGA